MSEQELFRAAESPHRVLEAFAREVEAPEWLLNLYMERLGGALLFMAMELVAEEGEEMIKEKPEVKHPHPPTKRVVLVGSIRPCPVCACLDIPECVVCGGSKKLYDLQTMEEVS